MVTEDVSFVIPAKDEAGTIYSLVSSILELYPKAEVIVVNDGSSDDTRQLALTAGAHIVDHVVSLGNGAAIKSGVRSASSATVVLMDADGQHEVDDVAELLEVYQQGYDLVVGARRGRAAHSSVARWLANEFYNSLSSLVTNFKILDLTSGLRVVNREKLLEVLYLLPNGFSYPTTSTMAFLRSGYQVGFAPVNVKPCLEGSHINPLKDGFRFLLIIFKVIMLYSPFKVFAPLAIIQLLIGGMLYLPGLLSGAPTFTNGMAFLMSGAVLTLSVAVLSEQLTVLLYR